MNTEEPRVTLISKPGCHLCTLARQVIVRVTDEMNVGWQEQSILDLDDPDTMWWEQLPITLVDGRQHDYWRVSESRLRAALSEPAGGEVGSHAGRAFPTQRRSVREVWS